VLLEEPIILEEIKEELPEEEYSNLAEMAD
jgi:hypothetical protein